MEIKNPPVRSITAAIFIVLSSGVGAVSIYDDFPEVIHANESYVIYSHGRIVEGDDARPRHPELGIYDFPAVKEALFRDAGFNLIADHRPKDTDAHAYARVLETWVRRLIAAGVEPTRITLVGFSKGGYLTAFAADRIRDARINTVLLATCLDGDVKGPAPLRLSGTLLSIYETTDTPGSCERLAQRSDLTSFKEVAISTGKGHGAFYQPLPEWVQPLRQWLAEVLTRTPSDLSQSGRGVPAEHTRSF